MAFGASADMGVIFWGGLRGAVPLALVLGLPADFEHRILVIDLTLGCSAHVPVDSEYNGELAIEEAKGH